MERNKQVKRGLIIILVLILLFATPTMAASKKKKALKAYAAFLSKPSIKRGTWPTLYTKNCRFAIAYIDNNNTPEMVLYHEDSCHALGWLSLYTFRGGKVSLVGYMYGDYLATLGYYKKTGFILDNYTIQGSGGYWYHKLSKGKLVAYDDRVLKKVIRRKKLTKYRFHKNTKKNRRRYLK